jgi:hypothetical protein
MANNLACIGLTAHDQESFGELIDALLERAVEDAPEGHGVRHLRWKDPSGASVGFHLSGNSLDCVTPFFDPPDGLSAWRTHTTAPAPDPECIHCSGAECDFLDADGSLATRSAVQWLNFLPSRAFLAVPRTFDLEVAAFARSAEFFTTPEAFHDGQAKWWTGADGKEPVGKDGKPLRLAAVSFMPEGMFAGPNSSLTERAIVTFAGHVERAEQLKNTLTGAPFQRVRIRTLPGSIDTLVAPESPLPAVGSIGFVRAWIVGRPKLAATG